MTDFRKMVLDHAHWSAAHKRMKRERAAEIGKCCHATETNGFENCLNRAYKETVRLNNESLPYDGYSFDEVLTNMEGPEACAHCIRARELKKPIGDAGRKLGAIRAAMSRAAASIGQASGKE